ncbi:MAG: glycosyltransferase family 9 protein [Angustibacter sp.]
MSTVRPRSLVVRWDSDGDVLLAGPAVRAVAAGSSSVTLLVSPAGAQAAALLPDVDEVLVHPCPWSGYQPPPVDPGQLLGLVAALRGNDSDAWPTNDADAAGGNQPEALRGDALGPGARFDVAVVLTSDHQSPLPTALLLRLAGVPRVIASSHDYPGSLLDVRHPPGGPHEVQRNLSLVATAGFAGRPGDDGLAVRGPLPALPGDLRASRGRYVVLHPNASVPARGLTPAHAATLAAALRDAGHPVVVTGSTQDHLATRLVPFSDATPLQHPTPQDPAPQDPDKQDPAVHDLVGRTDYRELAAVLAEAACVVTVNTGPAHLAAAVGTPVVSLFAPVVPAAAWRPWRVRHVLLGDQHAECAGSRARSCPTPGHPCLGQVGPARVVAAVRQLTGLVAGPVAVRSGAPGERLAQSRTTPPIHPRADVEEGQVPA